MSKNPYDEVADIYDKSFLSKTAKVEDELIYGWLHRFLHMSSILDLGCGTGAFLEHLSWQDYVGLDSSKKMLKLAHQKFPRHAFVLADMRKLPFKNEVFSNAVSLYGPLSYAGPEALVEADHVLVKGGRFFHMVFSKKYDKRKTYILNRAKIRSVFVPYGGKLAHMIEHKAKGFNSYGDCLEWMPKSFIRFLMGLDLISKIHKYSGYFIIMYGEKP